MRIMGFSRKWDKLTNPEFSTFRFTRKDKDWKMGECVKVVLNPRKKGGGEYLGIAQIIEKVPRAMAWHGDKTGITPVTNEEANADGFPDNEKRGYFKMWEFLFDNYGGERLLSESMNKLTLFWREKVSV